VCQQLRQSSAIPLLILGATDDEDETVRTLEAGADDYMTGRPARASLAELQEARAITSSPMAIGAQ
jgi:DNA-binding response OmpR family regulator